MPPFPYLLIINQLSSLHKLPIPLPLLPITNATLLLPSLLTYTTAPPQQPSQLLSTISLLPHITATSPSHPLPIHTTNILSDITHSLEEIISLTETENGRKELGRWVGREELSGLVEFWEGEWICE